CTLGAVPNGSCALSLHDALPISPVQQWNAGVEWASRAPDARVLFVREVDALEDCLQRANARHVGVANRRTWALVSPAALPADCRVLPEPAAGEMEADPDE